MAAPTTAPLFVCLNARIADLIREEGVDEIPDAIGEGAFFQMQTFNQALTELVLNGEVDRETATNASTNPHDFELTLEHALRRQGVEQTVVEEVVEDPLSGLRIVPPASA